MQALKLLGKGVIVENTVKKSNCWKKSVLEATGPDIANG